MFIIVVFALQNCKVKKVARAWTGFKIWLHFAFYCKSKVQTWWGKTLLRNRSSLVLKSVRLPLPQKINSYASAKMLENDYFTCNPNQDSKYTTTTTATTIGFWQKCFASWRQKVKADGLGNKMFSLLLFSVLTADDNAVYQFDSPSVGSLCKVF